MNSMNLRKYIIDNYESAMGTKIPVALTYILEGYFARQININDFKENFLPNFIPNRLMCQNIP